METAIFVILSVILGIASVSAHELGHYCAMRRYGVAVKAVALFGIPAKWLPRFRWKVGDEDWSVSPLLPIGAFVMPRQETNVAALPFWDQVHVYANGATANLAFTATLAGIGFSARIVEGGGDPVGALLPTICGVTLAAIVWKLQRYVPALFIAAAPFLAFLILKSIFSVSPPEALDAGAGGPVALGSLLSKARHLSDALMLPALVSLNLAAFNLLPIPPLDGGQILLAATKKVAGEKAAEALLIFGALGILALMVYALGLDVARIVKFLSR